MSSGDASSRPAACWMLHPTGRCFRRTTRTSLHRKNLVSVQPPTLGRGRGLAQWTATLYTCAMYRSSTSALVLVMVGLIATMSVGAVIPVSSVSADAPVVQVDPGSQWASD